MLNTCGGPGASGIRQDGNPAVHRTLVKREDAHWFEVAAGCAFVIGIVMETLETLLTAWMRWGRVSLSRQGFCYQKQSEDCEQREKDPFHFAFVHTL